MGLSIKKYILMLLGVICMIFYYLHYSTVGFSGKTHIYIHFEDRCYECDSLTAFFAALEYDESLVFHYINETANSNQLSYLAQKTFQNYDDTKAPFISIGDSYFNRYDAIMSTGSFRFWDAIAYYNGRSELDFTERPNRDPRLVPYDDLTNHRYTLFVILVMSTIFLAPDLLLVMNNIFKAAASTQFYKMVRFNTLLFATYVLSSVLIGYFLMYTATTIGFLHFISRFIPETMTILSFVYVVQGFTGCPTLGALAEYVEKSKLSWLGAVKYGVLLSVSLPILSVFFLIQAPFITMSLFEKRGAWLFIITVMGPMFALYITSFFLFNFNFAPFRTEEMYEAIDEKDDEGEDIKKVNDEKTETLTFKSFPDFIKKYSVLISVVRATVMVVAMVFLKHKIIDTRSLFNSPKALLFGKWEI
ncbi:hypothetical protein PCE1_002078 [Barthelona sp. PCE]